jgi:hypothetical protein
VYQPELFDDPPRFLSGCVGAYGGQLLPVCCPDAASLIFVTAIQVARAYSLLHDLGAAPSRSPHGNDRW